MINPNLTIYKNDFILFLILLRVNYYHRKTVVEEQMGNWSMCLAGARVSTLITERLIECETLPRRPEPALYSQHTT